MGMLFLWALPLMKPIRRCIESRLYKVYPIITIFNLIIFGIALDALDHIDFNELFFLLVKIVEVAIAQVEKVLIAGAGLLVLVVMWKFKDRVLEALGVDNPQMVIGGFRDWATCWSMKRFYPVELFILKVEGLPAINLGKSNDVFCEVSLGYNMTMRTRVRCRAGHSCTIKESLQLNFDPFDTEVPMHISVKNQELLGTTEIASIQLGAKQVQRLEEPHSLEPSERTLGWGATAGTESAAGIWAASRFQCIDLVPAGKLYMRFQ